MALGHEKLKEDSVVYGFEEEEIDFDPEETKSQP
jgi:hypothetical protein